MQIHNRAREALYTVIVKRDNAKTLLDGWAGKSACAAEVSGNKMNLFDQRSFSLFVINWEHGWDRVLIWDCWNRRHVYL